MFVNHEPRVRTTMPRVDNKAFYRGAMAKHGATPQGLHWRSAYTQTARFVALARCLPEDLGGVTLVDAGCGFGDLYAFLCEHRGPPAGYVGLEVCEPMIQTARERTGCEIRLQDVLRDPLPEADFYVCSGAMNNLTREETRCFIQRCHGAARQAFVFNILKGSPGPSRFNYYLPDEIRALGETLGARVEILEDYLDNDLTAAFRKT